MSKWKPALIILILGGILGTASWLRVAPANPYCYSDAAKYLGAARDYMETGVFAETVSASAFGRFLPHGLPFAIATTAQLFNVHLHDAGAIVTGFWGSLLPLVVWAFIFFTTRSIWLATLFGIFSVFSYHQIVFSRQTMTESQFTFWSMIFIAQLCFGFYLRQTKHFLLNIVGLAITFGIAFHTRYSAIVLLPLLAGSLAISLWRPILISRKYQLLGLGIFAILVTSIIGSNALRFAESNGHFSWIPLPGAPAIGEFRKTGNSELFRLDPTSTQPVWGLSGTEKEVAVSSTHLPPQTSQDIIQQLKRPFVSFWSTLVRVKSTGERTLYLVFFPLVFLLALPSVWRSFVSFRYDNRFLSLLVLTAYICGTLLAYGHTNYKPRYSVPLQPAVFCLLALFLSYAIETMRNWNRKHLALLIPITMTAIVVFLITTSHYPGFVDFNKKWMKTNYCALDANVALMKQQQGDSPPRILSTAWKLAYGTKGIGFAMPFSEDDPVKLAKYFEIHNIQYVTGQQTVKFDRYELGVAPLYLLDVLAEVSPTFVTKTRNLFALKPGLKIDPMQSIKSISTLPHQEIALLKLKWTAPQNGIAEINLRPQVSGDVKASYVVVPPLTGHQTRNLTIIQYIALARPDKMQGLQFPNAQNARLVETQAYRIHKVDRISMNNQDPSPATKPKS